MRHNGSNKCQRGRGASSGKVRPASITLDGCIFAVKVCWIEMMTIIMVIMMMGV